MSPAVFVLLFSFFQQPGRSATIPSRVPSTPGRSMEFFRNRSLFGRTRALETKVDEFLDKLSQSVLIFKLAIKTYLTEGPCPQFEENLRQVNELESQADALRRTIEKELYSNTLIPESRGDVLGLLENLDSIHNLLEGTLWSFSIETPAIPSEHVMGYQGLVEMVELGVEALVLASRSFFRDPARVNDHLHKVMLYEKEADKVSTRLKRAIFASEADLSQKTHLRHFVELIDNVADGAEDVADRLTIYTIKQKV